MQIAFYTLGCKVNQYETNAMMEQFMAAGYQVVDPTEAAAVYVLNSCTVTAESDRKSRQLLRRFRRQNPEAVVALCGCFPQAFPDVAEKLPEADIVLGTKEKSGLLQAVENRLGGGPRFVSIGQYQKGDAFESVQVESFGTRTRAFIKIQDGCQRYCAYCIIPIARGPVRSKDLTELVQEVRNLAASSYKEVVLVGINLSCYGEDLGFHLLDAIKTVAGVEGIERVRLGSLEPELLSGEQISKMAAIKKLCPQFHLSLQSGSDATLKRMRRHYDTSEYRRIVKDLRAAFPACAITTDIMVGFPGETEEEFRESVAFIKEVGVARAHVFSYSRRPGTAADIMKDQTPPDIKSQRSKAMRAATNETRKTFLDSQLGTVHQVLFETRNEEGYWTGYTPNYTQILVDSREELGGKYKRYVFLHRTKTTVWGNWYEWRRHRVCSCKKPHQSEQVQLVVWGQIQPEYLSRL